MQLVAIEPVHRGFASRGRIGTNFVLSDTTIVADCQLRSIDEADAAARAKAGLQIAAQWHDTRWYPFDKPLVAD